MSECPCEDCWKEGECHQKCQALKIWESEPISEEEADRIRNGE